MKFFVLEPKKVLSNIKLPSVIFRKFSEVSEQGFNSLPDDDVGAIR